jgi:mannose-6-phosphate isomerase-like protein (cupin superfamily)
MNMTLAAIVLAALTPSVVDKTGPDTSVRHITGKELGETINKGMTPNTLYSQVLLAKHDNYQLHITERDRDGGAEVHEDWYDHIFIQEGEASFVVGGVAVDPKITAPGETRGTSVKDGTTIVMHPGDYLFIPPGIPHQMLVKPGQHARFIGFRTHK